MELIRSTFYYHPTDKKLSIAIQDQLAKQTPLRNNGVRYGDYFVLRNNHQQSILIELGFITTPNELNAIQSESYQNQVADSIVQGLINYLDS
ncbi:N-acetylmuramoyl-L-alanine amidase [Pseudogracilibacillus auburnensis]|nr:N-acetylmuramoyl-L-alanine amidase [Pseudogracilibacillus auburnensis]